VEEAVSVRVRIKIKVSIFGEAAQLNLAVIITSKLTRHVTRLLGKGVHQRSRHHLFTFLTINRKQRRSFLDQQPGASRWTSVPEIYVLYLSELDGSIAIERGNSENEAT